MRIAFHAFTILVAASFQLSPSVAQPVPPQKPTSTIMRLPPGAVTTNLPTLAQPNPQPTPEPDLPPGERLMPINWEQVRDAVKGQQLQRGRFRQMTLEPNAPRTSLPILLPFDPGLADAVVHIFPRPHAYAASLRLGDLSIEVHGDRRALVIDEKSPLQGIITHKQAGTLQGSGVPFALDRTEGGYDLTFGRFGAAYLVSVECADVEHDSRCVKADFVQSLAEKMGLFGKDAP